MASNGNPVRKIPPPPPSIGSSSGDSGKPKPPPAPSMAASKRPGGAADSSTTKRQRADFEHSGIPNLTQEQKKALGEDQAMVHWLYGRGPTMELTYDSLCLGRHNGPVEPELYVDTTFCRATILQQLMDIKYDIMKVDKERFFKVRETLHTYDKLFGKDQWFVNSNFIKAANIDALCEFQLSNPRNSRNETLLGPNELLYFADINGAPGGFAEYILWKKQWNARGFGFTSKAKDWKLPLKPHYHKECFEQIYGFWEYKGSGDIHNPEEVMWFIKKVRTTTFRKGVHVAFADGGDVTDGDEDKKELRCKYMFLAEALIGLAIVRDGGHFVLKIYDMFTPFTVGLVYLLHQVFESLSIHKPETALKASSERYVICKGKKSNKFSREIVNYLQDCHKFFKNTQRMFKNADQQVADILELVPVHVIRNNQKFMAFVMNANEFYGKRQLEETRSVNADILSNSTQAYIKQHLSLIHRKATTLWGIPRQFTLGAKYTDSPDPNINARKLIAPYPEATFSQIDRDGEQDLVFQTMEDELTNPGEWQVFLVGRDRGFFMSLGEDNVYRFDRGSWIKAGDKIELAANTLVYADIVDEITIFENRQVTTSGLHIMDAIVLGGKDLRSFPHEERLEFCLKFSRAMDRPNRQDIAAVRAKTPYELTKIESILRRATESRLKGGSGGPTKEATFPIDGSKDSEESKQDLVFKPSGALLVKTMKQNSIPGDFLFAMQNRLIWRWNENVSLEVHNPEALDDAKDKVGPIHAATLLDFMRNQN